MGRCTQAQRVQEACADVQIILPDHGIGHVLGFQRVLLYDLFEDGLTNRSRNFTARGLYSGTDLYVAGNDFLISFDMKDGFRKEAAVDYT